MFVRKSLGRNATAISFRVASMREATCVLRSSNETICSKKREPIVTNPLCYVPLQARKFSTVPDSTQLSLNESEFHEIADKTLEELVDCLSKLEESIEDLDVELSVCIVPERFMITTSKQS